MIKFTDNKSDIVSLWSSVFGDSDEDVIFFIENAKNADCLAYYEGEKLVSMLYLVDCCIGGEKGKYIYAACTDKHYEGRGYMTALLQYSKNCGYNCLCLIPASDSLVEYYGKRGFQKSTEIENLSFNQSDEIKEYLFEGYELSEPRVLICEV